jgi:hypothetical protein
MISPNKGGGIMDNGKRYAEWALVFAAGCVAGWLWAIRPGVLAEIEWLQVMTAFGTVGAVIAAVALAVYQNVIAENARRREPLWALRAIIDHGNFLIKSVPYVGPASCEVEYYFKNGGSDSFKTAQEALASFPIDKLLDYSAIRSLFEMQAALSGTRSIVESIGPCSVGWTDRWYRSRDLIRQARISSDLALANLQVAIDGAAAT